MNQPRGHVWVDPEGVISVGDSYAQHTARYHECLRRLNLLRARYERAWGDDEIGNQFQNQFSQTMDGVEGAILTVLGYLEYAAVGLRVSGEGYRQADEDAAVGGQMIAGEFANLPFRPAAGDGVPTEHAQRIPLEPVAGERAQYALRRPVDGEPGQLTPQLAVGRVEHAGYAPWTPVDGELGKLTPRLRVAGPIIDPEAVESPTSFLASRRPAEFAEASPAIPASPAISAFRRYDTTGVLVDGDPIPPGYELRTLTTFPDGTSRIDANGYDSIIPLGTRTPISTDGHPVDSDGDQFFLLKPKEDAVVDPTVPGYRPLLISFGPDGSATPLFVDPA
ncbi:hypothetical protein [Micromonospora sp. NBRC 101691]|uniref:hypothetical protein n=1 Tax=Micromonospora sp. NBRC 101691 TaxID=3032198 RepID=UPI0024A00D2B|nr:hypothetical protein [Micromonospora sp. NBRC 101691]GLY23761.1 hypothetical protein Misp04_34930 [Micromonospora sp. NBRC 101691]